jgi:DNA-binding XRE family transcriptional regulator
MPTTERGWWNFRDNVRWLRRWNGLTQQDVATRAGISLRTMVTTEKDGRSITVYRLRMLAQALGVAPDVLLTFNRHPDWRARHKVRKVSTPVAPMECVTCGALASREGCSVRCRAPVPKRSIEDYERPTFGLLPGEEDA